MDKLKTNKGTAVDFSVFLSFVCLRFAATTQHIAGPIFKLNSARLKVLFDVLSNSFTM